MPATRICCSAAYRARLRIESDSSLLEAENLEESDRLRTFTIQESGGTAKTIKRGIDLIKEMGRFQRTDNSGTSFCKALGSCLAVRGFDGYSGVTANRHWEWQSTAWFAPAAPRFYRKPPRFMAPSTCWSASCDQRGWGKLIDGSDGGRSTRRGMTSTWTNNPSPGNKAGGLTTILRNRSALLPKAAQLD